MLRLDEHVIQDERGPCLRTSQNKQGYFIKARPSCVRWMVIFYVSEKDTISHCWLIGPGKSRQGRSQQAMRICLLSQKSEIIRFSRLLVSRRDNYPDCHAGRRKATTAIGAWHLGHLKTGLGRGNLAAIMTFKASCTTDSSFLALPCRKP